MPKSRELRKSVSGRAQAVVTSVAIRVKFKVGSRKSLTGLKQMSMEALTALLSSDSTRPRDADKARIEMYRRGAVVPQ